MKIKLLSLTASLAALGILFSANASIAGNTQGKAIGVINLDSYCYYKRTGPGKAANVVLGRSDVYGWSCLKMNDPKVGVHTLYPIDMQEACRWEYDTRYSEDRIYADFTDYNDPNS